MLRTTLKVFDSISEFTGKVICWACLLLMFFLTYEVVSRYVFNRPTLWSYDSTRMLVCAITAIGWAYTHRHQGHVRVDIIYSQLSLRGKAIIDVAGGLFFFMPVVVGLLYSAWTNMIYAWSIGEKWVTSPWEPPTGPIRTAIFLGFALFLLQGIAQLVRDSFVLIRGKLYD